MLKNSTHGRRPRIGARHVAFSDVSASNFRIADIRVRPHILSVDTSNPVVTDDERVDQAGLGSFPASDPPPWTSGREPDADADTDAADPDGGDNRDRERRRRHLDA